MKGVAKYWIAPALAMCISSAATATPVSLSTNFNVWQGHSPSPGDPTDPTQQALPTNPVTSQTLVGFFSYTGPISFVDNTQATDLMSNFIPGVGLPALQMSTMPNDLVSLFEFTFVLPTGVNLASITHNDGISLFDITTSSGNLIPGNEHPVTSTSVTSLLPTLTAGDNYELWFAATNGAPSILIFNGPDRGPSVPEPSTWALLTLGFGLAGFAARKGRQSARNRSAECTG